MSILESAPPKFPYCTEFHFKQITLKFRNQIVPKNVFPGTEFEKSIVKFRISTSEFSLVPSFILNKVFWSFGTKLPQKKYFRDRIWENNCRIQNLHPWVPLCAEFHSKQSTLNFWDQICPKEVFYGRNLKKLFLNSKSAALNTPIVSSFILNEALQSTGTKMPQKDILGMEPKKAIVKFGIRTTKYFFVRFSF